MTPTNTATQQKDFDILREKLGTLNGKVYVQSYKTTFKDSGEISEGIEVSREVKGKYDPSVGGRVSRYVNFRFSFEDIYAFVQLLKDNQSLAKKIESVGKTK